MIEPTDIDIRIVRRNGQWSFELSVDGRLFATGSEESLIDCAETANLIVIDKVDMPASYFAEFDDA